MPCEALSGAMLPPSVWSFKMLAFFHITTWLCDPDHNLKVCTLMTLTSWVII